MNASPRFSVIVCSIEALKFARICECYTHLLSGYPHEIIGIHDAASLAEAYNRGIAQASGDILIFSHDDLLILDPLFADKIVDRLHTFDLLGFAGTSKLITATWFGAGQPHLRSLPALLDETLDELLGIGLKDAVDLVKETERRGLDHVRRE